MASATIKFLDHEVTIQDDKLEAEACYLIAVRSLKELLSRKEAAICYYAGQAYSAGASLPNGQTCQSDGTWK